MPSRKQKPNMGSGAAVSTTLEERLIDAVLLGQYLAVSSLLEQGAPVNPRDPEHGETALMLASGPKDSDIARFLIEKGADVNLHDNRGWSALMCAAMAGSRDTIRLLIENGADIEAHDINDKTALLHAVAFGNVDAIRLLIEHGADIAAHDEDDGTALLFAVATGDIEAVKVVSDYLPEPVALEDQKNALQRASTCGFVGIRDFLQKRWGENEK